MYINIWYIQTLAINFKNFWSIIKKSYPLGLYVNYIFWSVKVWSQTDYKEYHSQLQVRGHFTLILEYLLFSLLKTVTKK